jgi:hypothetical protein
MGSSLRSGAGCKCRTIHNCRGRFVLENPKPTLAPQELAGVGCVRMEHRVRTAKDVVVVLPLDGGGLITYRRADGTYLYTLNTEFGFKRKLAQLGITLP